MSGFITIAIIAFLAALSPGPDFVVIAKNAIAHSRRTGIFSSIGIGVGILFHSTYCVLGLAVIITHSLLVFSGIKYIGALYLIYLGVKALFAKKGGKMLNPAKAKTTLSAGKAFQQGLLTNVLNPKCTLFMLSVFTLVIHPGLSYSTQALYGIEIALITALWFVLLSVMLTHKTVKAKLDKVQHWVTKIMGVFLIGFGIEVALLHRH